MKRKHKLLTLLTSVIVLSGVAQAAPVNISTLPGVTDDSGTGAGPFRVTGNVTLSFGTDYLLDEEIYVDGGTLTIQPGVMIPCDTDGALIVARGSQIFAEGTAEQPIVFTSLDEYNHLQTPNDPNTPAPEIGDNGKWGGVIILGKAPVNYYVAGNPFTGDLTGNTNRGEMRIEGVSDGADTDGDGIGDLLEYGQDNALVGQLLQVVTPADPEDNSGVFKYVSIRFGGKVLGLDNEINGLTMGGVGRGTTIEFVEVINNSDDGFEWFGGTVNCNNLVSFANEDEDFDMDEGFSGKLQFLFALRNDEVDGAGNVENGSELDGGNGSIFTGTPLTSAQVWNATYLGAGRVGAVSAKGNVFRMKDNFAGQFHNCVFDDFGGNLVRIDDTNTAARVTDGSLKIENSHWGRYNGTVAQTQTTAATTLANGTGNSNPTAKIDPKMRGISRTNDGGLDPRPAADSPLFNATLSTPPAGLEAVSYRGAFGATNWASGWTYLDAAGYFGDLAAGTEPVAISSLPGVTDDSGTGAGPFRITSDVTLISGVDYLLDEEIYVDGGTLTIQPGVMIPCDTDGALIVARGSQIFAEGTAEQPIVFTSLDEYNHLQTPNDPNTPAPEIGDNGKWGGVIILGKAPVNYYVAGNPFTGDLTGNTNRGEMRIEGVSDGADTDGDGIGDLLEYGQDNALVGQLLQVVTPADPEDNSGVFKYVSIRFGGKVLGLDNEINGLTMGGVGRGTTIEFVEVINNSDDGFEWFGGTVNCNNLVSFANEDEDFDMDEGFSGKLQFLFALRNDEVDGAGNVENGSELDGGNGSIFTGTPLTSAQVWNATYLGAGRVGAVSAKGNVFRMKDNFAGQFHNCVFDDFGGNLVRIDDTNTAARVTDGSLKIENSHWGRYNGTVAQTQTTAATTLANGTGNSNPTQKINPLLGGISRQPNGGLDPRPNTFSPLYGATLSTPPAGLETVNYRGAFGSTNWAEGWTYLDSAGYFGNLATVPPVTGGGEPPFVDSDNDGIDDALEVTPALVALGFVVGADDSVLFADLFTETSIQDLSVSDLIVQKVGNDVTVTIPVESSVDLVPPFTPEGNAILQLNGVPADKEFYRIRLAPDAP
jgi:hypothetical protein